MADSHMRLILVLTLLLTTGASSLIAADTGGDSLEAATAKLRAARPDLPIERVSASPVPGLVAIELAGEQVLYATADGSYLIAGDLYAVGEDLRNVTEDGRAERRKVLMDAEPASSMVVFPATGERKAYVQVFTDVDCGYCQKLHREMAQINALGIEVRYLAYPRAGVGSPSYQKLVSAWCASNPQQAITDLKAGRDVPQRSCLNPVAKQYALGQKVGISGTPAIIAEDGRLFPGYMQAAALAQALGL